MIMATDAGAAEKQKNGIWKRPEHLLVPRVWLRENGIVVRDVTPDLHPYVIQHMKENYLRDEPVNQAAGALDDPLCLAEILQLWEHVMLPQKVSIVALQEGTPGANLEPVSAENPPEVIGVNLLLVVTKYGSPMTMESFQGEKMKLIMGTFFRCGSLVNAFERYGVDTYLVGTGLSVVPSWRCKGVGKLIVKARDRLCREMSIPLTRTIFTAIQSQKVALKSGFELLGEISYDDYKTPDGQPLFPNMHPDQKKIQVMAKRIPTDES